MPRCRYCSTLYKPARAMQPGRVCNDPECQAKFALDAIAKQRTARLKVERKATREAKEKLKTRSDYIKEAQIAVNAYRRELLKDEPCISCGRHHSGQYHAGHYISVGSHPELRFEELNIWKQCQPCNTHLSGNLINYRKALVARIGLEKVEWLEGKHEPKNYSISDIKEIIIKYKGLLNELKRNGL